MMMNNYLTSEKQKREKSLHKTLISRENATYFDTLDSDMENDDDNTDFVPIASLAHKTNSQKDDAGKGNAETSS